MDVDEALARRLLQNQHEDLAGLPISSLDAGWDNVIFRLGEALTVRIPRRQVAADLIRNEQLWLPRLSSRLPIPAPTPVRLGTPTDFYPWHWSINPFFAGRSADVQPPRDAEAARFAEFLLALHQPAPAEAPENPVRGVPLSVRAENTRERMARLREKTDLITPAVEAIWASALAAPPSQDRRWLHGDLHAQNVLVAANGVISAIIDWGDLTAGDLATDLAGIWALFDSRQARSRALEVYAPDPDLLSRARGWAVIFGVVLVDSGLINSPRHAEAGRKILERVAGDPAALQ